MVVSLKCFFLCVFHAQLHSKIHEHERGRHIQDKRGTSRHMTRLFCCYFPDDIYISLWSDYTLGIKTQKEGRIEQNRTVCAVPHLLNMFLNVQMHMYLCLRACEVFTWRRLHCALLYVYALFPLQLCDSRCVYKDCVYLRVPHFSYSRTCVRYRCVR